MARKHSRWLILGGLLRQSRSSEGFRNPPARVGAEELELLPFGGVAAVLAVAVSGLARRQRRRGLPWLLVGAVSAWSLSWTGFLIYTGTVGVDMSLEIGFWLQAASIAVAVIGTVLVATRRVGTHERHAAVSHRDVESFQSPGMDA